VVAAGVEVQVFACPETVKITVPVGAGSDPLPVIKATKLRESPVFFVPIIGMKPIVGAIDAKLIVIVEEEALL
jgi:hypothetical protein